MSIKPRNVTPIIAWIRDFFGQRDLVSVHRFETEWSSRTFAPVKLPGGVSHKSSENFYFNRDGRRDALPPTVVFDEKPLLANSLPIKTENVTVPKPGFGFNWEDGKRLYAN